MKRLFVLFFLFCIFVEFSFSQSNEFPYSMFVTSREGLRVRSSPSLNSETKDRYLYAQMVRVYARSENRDTIDGITDYWYKVQDNQWVSEWVFGGYLSNTFPREANIFLGRWLYKANDTNSARWSHHFFNFDNSYVEGPLERGGASYGRWSINNNILTITMTHGIDEGGRSNYSAERRYRIEVIDNNNINLIGIGTHDLQLVRAHVNSFE
jgi:hypothetical protein